MSPRAARRAPRPPSPSVSTLDLQEPFRRRAPTRESLRLVVFDWDGTLMDSIGTIVDCTLAAVGDVPGAPVPAAQTVRESIGLGLVETMQRFFPAGDPDLFTAVATAYRARWLDEYKDRVTLLPGVIEAVRHLAGAGYLVGVATAKSRAGLERELTKTGLGDLFHATRTVDEAPSKPAPGMLLQLFDELGVFAHQALMVGDTAWDLQMASNAGCGGVGVLTGGHSREQLEAAAALACLGSVAELPAWLGVAPRVAG
jgi:phosphoglycolate phosphatase